MVNNNFTPDTSGALLGDSNNSNGYELTQQDSLSTIETPLSTRLTSSSSPAVAAVGPEIEIENLDGVPFSNRLVFSRIGSFTNPPPNGVHDVVTLRTKNLGSSPLKISGVPITGPWELANNAPLPTSIAAGGQLDLRVRFKATSGDIHNGTLTIKSNDSNEPNTVVQLAGFWQRIPEGGGEPTLNEIVKVFGYGTTITNPGQELNKNGLVQTVGDEVISPYWQRANTSTPVTVRQLAAFHKPGQTATVSWFGKGSSTTSQIFTHAGIDAQTLLPDKNNSTQLAQGTFNSNGTFGFRIADEWSDPLKNNQLVDKNNGSPGPSGHHVRFWQAEDRQGNAIANTWIMGMDYSGINYDYNDNVYLISNVKPETRTVLNRIDVGSSSSYTDSKANIWRTDTGLFTPTNAPAENGGTPAPAIANTVDDKIYQTYRGRVDNAQRLLTFNVPASGQVEVRLHFAELFWGAPGKPAGGVGKRVFDVTAEGKTVMDDYDITAASGGALKATMVSIRGIQVNDGKLTLGFDASVNYASVAGIEVLRM